MREIQIFTRKIELNQLPVVEHWANEKVSVKELENYNELKKIDMSIPTLLLIRMVFDETAGEAKQEWLQEKQEMLWSFLKAVDFHWDNIAVMLFLENKNFDILYKAMECHVDAVVVKSDNEEEIRNRLNYCLYKLEEHEQITENFKRLEAHEINSRQRIMSKLFEQILDHPEEVQYMVPEINKRYDMNLGVNNYQTIVILVNQFELYTKESSFMKDIARIAHHYLNSAREVIVHNKDPYGAMVLVNYPEHFSVKKYKEEIENLRMGVVKLKEKYGEFDVSVGVGDVVDSLTEVKKSLNHAAYVKEFRMLEDNKEKVFYSSELLTEDLAITSFMSEQSMKELCRYVFMGDFDRIRTWYAYFYKEIEPRFEKYPPAYAKYCWEMYVIIKEMAKAKKVSIFPDMKFFALAYRFEGHERMLETEKLLLEIAHFIQSELPSDKKLAQEAMAFMKVHFSEPINLAIIADACGVSNSYFSRKFKEQTGENYIDVLTEIRMKEAQRLLIETDFGIDEILEKLCYSDDKHFRNLFVNYTGMLPMAYRKANRKNK